MTARYFIELNEYDIKLIRNMCNVYYQISKENWAFKNMMESRQLRKRLNCLLEKKLN